MSVSIGNPTSQRQKCYNATNGVSCRIPQSVHVSTAAGKSVCTKKLKRCEIKDACTVDHVLVAWLYGMLI